MIEKVALLLSTIYTLLLACVHIVELLVVSSFPAGFVCCVCVCVRVCESCLCPRMTRLPLRKMCVSLAHPSGSTLSCHCIDPRQRWNSSLDRIIYPLTTLFLIRSRFSSETKKKKIKITDLLSWRDEPCSSAFPAACMCISISWPT